MSAVIFVTGTDTGVGKTLLTALILVHLRQHGHHALAMKPFCSGGLNDVRILQKCQEGELSFREMSPFYFPLPLAPLAASRRAGCTVALPEVLERIRGTARRCDTLLVEGAGGLFVPLGSDYTVAGLIAALRCPVLVVARNRLGAVNHTLLTLCGLSGLVPQVKIVLMDKRHPDLAADSNLPLIHEFAPKAEIFRLPFLGSRATAMPELKKNARKLKKTLAQILEIDTFCPAFEMDRSEVRDKRKNRLHGAKGAVE